MEKISKKVISLVLAAAFVFGMTASMHKFTKVSAATITTYEIGDIIEFGWYPQSEVLNASTISALNKKGGSWKSYGYYVGNPDLDVWGIEAYYNGKMTAKNFMRYKDVILGSDKYRGVVFDSCRPSNTVYALGDGTSTNGYYTGTVYWFKYEPIKWRVLDPDTGLVMAETMLDSQAYNNYIIFGEKKEGISTYLVYWGDSSKQYYASNYEKSSIRKWLNNDFYNTAFSSEQKNVIKKMKLDNTATNSEYNSGSTTDAIYLLSYDDVKNRRYGFSITGSYYDPMRQAQGSDYAKCQGLSVCSENNEFYGNSEWRLRTAVGSNSAGCVSSYGHTGASSETSYTRSGIRPALNFKTNVEISQPDTYVTTTTTTTTTTKPTTTKPTTTTTKPTTTKPTTTTTKPTATKPITTVPTTKPAETTKPTEPTTAKPVATEPVTTKPTEPSTLKPSGTINGEFIKDPSTSKINYGETLILHADFTNIPADVKIEWSVEGKGTEIKPSADGKTCGVTSTATGDSTVTAKYVDSNGVEHISKQEIKSNASFWQKIVSFFKNLFGINRTIEQSVRFR